MILYYFFIIYYILNCIIIKLKRGSVVFVVASADCTAGNCFSQLATILSRFLNHQQLECKKGGGFDLAQS